jgi:purine-binding chemotaxis protein CheW
MTTAAVETQLSHYVTFTLRGQTYALDVSAVREIVQYLPVTPVPQSARALRGVTNLRGTVIPVIDPGVKFGSDPAVPTRHTCVMVVEVAQPDGSSAPVGVLVDTVRQVLDLEPSDVLPVPPVGTGISVSHLSAIARVGSRFIPILNLEPLLAMEDLVGGGGRTPDA